MREYAVGGSPAQYQEDHLISLELGGHPTDARNLWPEPYPRAAEVDSIENDLNAKVCSGSMSLDEAQRKESELKHSGRLAFDVSTAAVERRAFRETLIVRAALVLLRSGRILLATALPGCRGTSSWNEDEAVADYLCPAAGDVLHTVCSTGRRGASTSVLGPTRLRARRLAHTLRGFSLVFALARSHSALRPGRAARGSVSPGLTAAAGSPATSPAARRSTRRLDRMTRASRSRARSRSTSSCARSTGRHAARSPPRRRLPAADPRAPVRRLRLRRRAGVALWLWRLRALPVALLALPLVLPYLRLPGTLRRRSRMSAPERRCARSPAPRAAWASGWRSSPSSPRSGVDAAARDSPRSACCDRVPPSSSRVRRQALAAALSIFVLPVWTTFVAAGLARMPCARAFAAAVGHRRCSHPRRRRSAHELRRRRDRSRLGARARPQRRRAVPVLPVFLAALRSLRRAGATARAVRSLACSRRTGIRPDARRHPDGNTWSVLVVARPVHERPHALARAAPTLHGIARAAAV
jgi:hypothetical protein